MDEQNKNKVNFPNDMPPIPNLNDEATKLIDLKKTIIQEAEKLTINKPMDFSTLEQQAPTFAKFIKDGIRISNDASALDVDAPKPDKFELVNTTISSPKNFIDGSFGNTSLRGMVAQVVPSALSDDHKPLLRIEKASLNEMSLEDLSTAVAHEYGHELRAKSYPASFMAADDAAKRQDFVKMRIEELEADRAADALGAVELHLKHASSQNFNIETNHPSIKDRTGALLAEYYGNNVFKAAGTFADSDNKFHPIMLGNGMPITEDGKQVANWKAIEPKIDALVQEDLNWLDSKLSKGLSDAEIEEFKQRISDAQKQLQTPQLKDELPWYRYPQSAGSKNEISSDQSEKFQNLAASLVQNGVENKGIVQENLKTEPRMSDVYAALEAAKKDISTNQLYSGEEKMKLEKIATLSIAKHLELGEFPKVSMIEQQEKDSSPSK